MISIAALLLVHLSPVVAASSPAAVETAQPARPRLARGTVIPLTLRQRLSTKSNVKGDLFDMVVAEDIRVGGRIVIPAGSRAVGEVTRCEPKGAFGRSGKIEARALYVSAQDRSIRISGALSARGAGAPAETILTATAIGVLSFVVTGKSAEIAEGTEMQVSLESDVEL